ncbi:FHA domain-containing protein [Nocardioides sp. KIGAM211]|uniref:FHA domain-containing protein n=1 Tax=Nocardioides luti TaxID=2761101 RepID=A0A7X0VBE3_9ACTN|nr:FHA domain-containing protein [Nocardioides luti]MBB6628679.1 FHA domain-containing protein [Nocardioides luti]
MSDEADRSMRSYRPGAWFGIFGDRATVILPPTEKARVAKLWELIDDGAGFDETLDALIADGLRDLPGFVLVSENDDEVKVVLRGAARATFTVDGEPVELEGSSATTWVERSLRQVTRMTVVVDEDGDGEGADAAHLVIGGGLVRIARLDEPPYVVGVAGPDTEPDVAPVDEPLPDHVVVAGLEPADDGAGGDDAPEDDVSSMVEATADEEPVAEPEPEEESAFTPEPAFAPVPAAADDAPAEEPAPEAPAPEEPAEPELETVAQPVLDADAPGPDVSGADVPPPAEPPAGPPVDPAVPAGPAPVVEPEHDGMTRAGGWDRPEFVRQQPGIPGQPQAPSITSRPVASLSFSNGDVVEVDRAILVGRAPEARRFTATEQPRLVTVPSPNQEISSTHLEIRPGSGADHGSAVVTDMGSTNGTVLVQPGLPPEDLQPGIAVQLIPGAIIDLGDGVTIQVTNP